MPSVIKSALPIGLRGFVAAGVISIVMSSADSFLNGAATGCVNDIVGVFSDNISPRKQLFLARTTNLLVGVLAVVFAISIPNILDILIFAYNFWAPTILVPLAAALLGFRTSKAAFVTGITMGVFGTIAWKYGLGDPNGFDGLVFGIFCNLVGFTIASMLRARGDRN
jgi:SSS family solute:Na+ symporter